MFCFQGAVIYPDQENLGLSDIVRVQFFFAVLVVNSGSFPAVGVREE